MQIESQISLPGSLWSDGFIAILPRLENQARYRFRHLRTDAREEAVAETIAAACCNYQQLALSGRLQLATVSTLSTFAARHTAQGRHVGGPQRTGDVYVRSHRARREPGEDLDDLAYAATGRGFLPADAAAFRLDFAAWLMEQSQRDRRVIGLLASGERTAEVADRIGASPGRVSQLRRKFEASWRAMQAS